MDFKLIRYAFIVFWLFVQNNAYSQTTDHWETIIKVGDNCSYFLPKNNIGIDWTQKNFNDSNWEVGPSGLGFGDNDDNTVLPQATITVYMRFSFSVANKADIAFMLLDLDFDDGFVAYLNGVEVARENVKGDPAWDMKVTHDHEALMYSGGIPERYEMNEFVYSVLETGMNVLAIEVHNESASSSDLSSNVFLHAGISVVDSIFGPVPDWFEEPANYSEFNLPLMIINTHQQSIPDEPRIVADMGLISNNIGNLNYINDDWNEYSGKINIEVRGESSSYFAKKSYSIELQNADGSNNNVSLLGLPIENDFILYGPYSDKTLIKNVLTYELFRRTGRWAPGTRYIELVLNNDYRGVYVLTENIKRDKNRVDIDKLTAADVSPEDISGGYILRRDKTNDLEDAEWWTSSVKQPFHNQMWYQYFDPKYKDLTQDQASYIKNWMQEFDEVMSSPNFKDTETGYGKYMKTRSFIDLMFINEISKGVDNYNFSNYFYKENDNDGGQLVAGPPWDYNLGYGNLNYGDSWDAKETYGWCYPQGGRIYWYERLMEDENFQNIAFCRWTEFREGIYSDENVIAIIDSCILELGDAVDRNFSKFINLGKYLWPALEPVPETYNEEILNLKTWLVNRLAWMDTQWLREGGCSFEPPTDINLSNNNVYEDQTPGSFVAIISTSDIDSDTHRYSLVSGSGDTDNKKFTIQTNQLLTNTTFNYQNQPSYSIRIKSTDESYESLEKEFIIYVQNTLNTELKKSLDNSFTLYPNPSKGIIQILCNEQNIHELNMQIVNVFGGVLCNANGNLEEINVSLSEASGKLSRGVYYIILNVEGERIAKKFVKL